MRGRTYARDMSNPGAGKHAQAGLATRSEITGAAHTAMADCVMLNKGNHTLEVLKSLNDILSRSRRNNVKNRRLFRQLAIARDFTADKAAD